MMQSLVAIVASVALFLALAPGGSPAWVVRERSNPRLIRNVDPAAANRTSHSLAQERTIEVAFSNVAAVARREHQTGQRRRRRSAPRTCTLVQSCKHQLRRDVDGGHVG